MSDASDASWIGELPKADFPVGKANVTPGAMRVHVEKATHDAIWEHSGETLEQEVCGVLIGEPGHDDQGPHLRITGSIRGEFAEAEGTQVTFTHRTWDYIHEEKDRRYPDAKIVGWYHTHPGVGIFFSGMDRFIQENFFNLPWQVGLVVDPVAKEEGLFSWRTGRLERGGGLWVGDRVVQEDTASSQNAPAGEMSGHALSSAELEKNFLQVRSAVSHCRTELQREIIWLSRGLLVLVMIQLISLFFLWNQSRSLFLYENALRTEQAMRLLQKQAVLEELRRSGVSIGQLQLELEEEALKKRLAELVRELRLRPRASPQEGDGEAEGGKEGDPKQGEGGEPGQKEGQGQSQEKGEEKR